MLAGIGRVRIIVVIIALACALAAAAGQQSGTASPAAPPAYQVVVFEVAGCTYCRVFRDNVAPLYEASEQARVAPLRYVDITHGDPPDLKTLEPITIAPTVVLFLGNREIDRIPGYSGPATFLELIDTMLTESR
jgi:thioredoxin-related protein